MKYMTRDGAEEGADSLQDRFLRAVYGTLAGRILIRPFLGAAVSRAAGKFLSTHVSAYLVKPFVQSAGIDLSQCEKQKFDSYNDFFTRKLRKGARPLDQRENVLVSPCDGRLSVYPIDEGMQVSVKQTEYSVRDLLRDRKLAECYAGGWLFLFRLSVEDYHRYIFPDSGYQGRIRRINGLFHTVNPAAGDVCPIYKENTREYCILNSVHFGRVLMMEVGAMLVGQIENRPGMRSVMRGEEKGNFAFGGSTVILMFRKGWVKPDADIVSNSGRGYETKVLQGEAVGTALRRKKGSESNEA